MILYWNSYRKQQCVARGSAFIFYLILTLCDHCHSNAAHIQ